MDLTPYVDNLRRELAVAAEAGGDDARALAERLTAPLESAIRLALLDALSAAADEITRDLAPGSVEVRLRGRDPEFVVTPPPADAAGRAGAGRPPAPAAARGAPTTARTARINLRLPEQLKAAHRGGRRPRAAVGQRLARPRRRRRAARRRRPPRPPQRGGAAGQRFTGWVR